MKSGAQRMEKSYNFSMRWNIVRVIWFRELRDQLRDRRTIMMILILPLVLYPLAGLGFSQLALGLSEKQHRIGILHAEQLAQQQPPPTTQNVIAATQWITTPTHPTLARVPMILGSARSYVPFPPLLKTEGDRLVFDSRWLGEAQRKRLLLLVPFSEMQKARNALHNHQIDALIVIDSNFHSELEQGKSPHLRVESRPGEKGARQTTLQTLLVLERWRQVLKEVRFFRHGLPQQFDFPVRIEHGEKESSDKKEASGQLFKLLLQMFPFVLVMWSLAGALYPAVDLCAGEKERGTMETLLISPAQREEIVWGKFLAIWVFSAVTALLNLVSMAVTAWQFSGYLGGQSLDLIGLFWCLLLLLPLSAFFSALCLAIGAYARSTKEGQYYLMPLFLGTLPLLLATMLPAVELNPLYSMIPITGVALLLEQLLTTSKLNGTLGLYFIPVLVPMMAYSWFALRWAIDQFSREDVLFREAERWDLGLWARHVFREKEPRPGAGQAIFCFVMIFVLSWFSLQLGQHLITATAIRYIAFVLTPALAMAFILTTEPLQSLAVRMPQWWFWPLSVLLVLLLLPPLAGITVLILNQFPVIQELIKENGPLTGWLDPESGTQMNPWLAFLGFAFLPAICEELAFRGFILTGLQRRFRPRTAVFLSSFLFALAHMNVFQFLPTFLLGVVLAYVTTRCGSILPSILFHLLYNTLVLGSAFVIGKTGATEGSEGSLLLILALICTPLGLAAMWWMTKLQPHPAYVEYLRSDAGMKPAPGEEERRGGEES